MGYNNDRPKEVLRNTVVVARANDGEDFEYARCPEGQQALGLVKLKNIHYKTQWGEGDGFRFVLRSRSTPEAFVTLDTSNKIGGRSGFSKLCAKMLGKKLNEEELSDPDAMFALAQSFLGKWFLGTIEHQEWAPPDGGDPIIFVRIQDKTLAPHPSSVQWGNCLDFFKDGNSEKKSISGEQKTFDDMPDHGTSKNGGKSAVATKDKSVANAAIAGKPVHFGPHLYDFKLSDKESARKAQLKFIVENHGAFNETTQMYHFPEKLGDDYEKKYKGEWEAPKKIKAAEAKAVSFDDGDDLPEGFGDKEEADEEKIPFGDEDEE